jgi:hypothetical protein
MANKAPGQQLLLLQPHPQPQPQPQAGRSRQHVGPDLVLQQQLLLPGPVEPLLQGLHPGSSSHAGMVLQLQEAQGVQVVLGPHRPTQMPGTSSTNSSWQSSGKPSSSSKGSSGRRQGSKHRVLKQQQQLLQVAPTPDPLAPTAKQHQRHSRTQQQPLLQQAATQTRWQSCSSSWTPLMLQTTLHKAHRQIAAVQYLQHPLLQNHGNSWVPSAPWHNPGGHLNSQTNHHQQQQQQVVVPGPGLWPSGSSMCGLQRPTLRPAHHVQQLRALQQQGATGLLQLRREGLLPLQQGVLARLLMVLQQQQ